jgi:hypothetical protein
VSVPDDLHVSIFRIGPAYVLRVIRGACMRHKMPQLPGGSLPPAACEHPVTGSITLSDRDMLFPNTRGSIMSISVQWRML